MAGTVAERLGTVPGRTEARRRARVRDASRDAAELRWHQSYRRRLLVSDTVAVIVSVVLSYLLHRNGLEAGRPNAGPVQNTLVAAAIALAWVGLLGYTKSRDPKILGSGPSEYQRVFGATWRMFATLAIVAFVVQYAPARGYIAIAAPIGLCALLVERYAWRQWLHRRRADGQCVSTVLAIGHREHVRELVRDLNTRPDSGYRVVGACVPVGEQPEGGDILGVPVVGDLFSAASVAQDVGVHTVAVTGADALTADVVRRLGWELEPSGVDLMLTAALTDVAGPRIMITPAENVALVHVEAPRFTGVRYWTKSTIEWLISFAGLVVLLPLLVVVGVAVKATSSGPVFFRQERVGRNGTVFPMFKFRSMRVGAESELSDLVTQNEGAGLLFKIRDDPRVTSVGRLLRRSSIDEIPQLFNVLRGDMSLVGPRPPLPSEVSAYEADVRRRLLVKPGMTGLWQTSGRSELSWEQSVRLDVYYVENWTLFGDLMILARTGKAVLQGRGAY
ncbi:sugar transferase [Luteimicrobium subarcticum]|uniref:Undecaprenyl-phosphate galactose phosphotransferase WbaP/exopolysaccharide biosynthesis polyprenyl glycosylphosphotransferase n=1 Tax=Luteimicrobium subarcticum TaxID=620910 RepID=A0A2M8WSY7_9MICO|nr:sugar transferase [Luteimicrobium subarcticum]PJI94008.1 Undecaprenyl-phosphate galactose phosphotransferase WbaP/exopolysaccharide biosynthesis polyprenyl glycosylphosphotransferase [Luteimicrobium subarcticum]